MTDDASTNVASAPPPLAHPAPIEATDHPVMSDPPVTSDPWRRWASFAALAVVLAVGVVARWHGFTRFDLWFDDAWAAAPARVSFSAALHMVLTAPGYSLALRSWLRLDPTTTWFGQLPQLVLSLAGIPAVYALLRFFRSPRFAAVAGAAVIAVSPLTIQYSTRLKEYPFDLLACCVLLWLAERARRNPRPRAFATLAVASAACFFVSAGCASVLIAVWATLLVAFGFDREVRAALAASLLGALAGCGLVWLAFLRHIPPVLQFNWRRRGYLMDYRSLRYAERTLTMIFGGFFHAVTGYPVPHLFFQNAPGPHAPSVALLGAVVLGIAIVVPLAASIRTRVVTPALPAAMTLLIALVLAAADRVPMGDGRTDEVLYPALLVALAASVPAGARLTRRLLGDAPARAAGSVLAAALLVAAAVFGIAHPAKYPTISLRGLEHDLARLVRPGDVVYVDTFNSFGWCYYELSQCATKVGGLPPWPQGFRPVSKACNVFIPRHYGIPQPELGVSQRRAKRIWYVGYTYGTFDVGQDPSRYSLPVNTYMTGLLSRYGWIRAPGGFASVVFGYHAYAQLYVRGPSAQRAVVSGCTATSLAGS